MTSKQPAEHAHEFFTQSSAHPYVFKYLPFGPFDTVAQFVSIFVEGRIRCDPANLLFAVIDKCKLINDEPRLAGIIGFLNSNPINLSTEIGFAIILPEFQRTHVTTNAICLLLQYCLNLPSDPEFPGLGLRRVQWQAHSNNSASIKAAQRLGFHYEAVVRWQRALPPGKEGEVITRIEVAGDSGSAGPGRHTALLSICWDDWEYCKENILGMLKK